VKKTLSFPLNFEDVSLLLALTGIILFITSELISYYYGEINIIINRKKLRNTTYVVSIIFLVTVIIRLITLITTE